MAYEDDVSETILWGKIRYYALIAAMILLAATFVTQSALLDWLRAGVWSTAAYAAYRQGRALKRMGKDPDMAYLQCVLYVIVAVICIIL